MSRRVGFPTAWRRRTWYSSWTQPRETEKGLTTRMPWVAAFSPSSSRLVTESPPTNFPDVEKDVEAGPVQVGGEGSHPVGVGMAVGDEDVPARSPLWRKVKGQDQNA